MFSFEVMIKRNQGHVALFSQNALA